MLNELLDEPVDLEPEGLDIRDERALRSAMLRVAQLQRDAEVTKRRKKMVTETYDQELAQLERQEAMFRDSIETYIKRHNAGEKVRFPDVGTAYLGRVDPKIAITDRDAFEAALGALFTKPTFDETAAKQHALERAVETGELVPGTELIQADETLRIRKA